MGRNRNKKRFRRKKRSQAAQLEREYARSWRTKNIDNALNEDEFREKQSKYHKEMADKEKDVLSRSVFVTNVRDLKIESNLKELRHFFVSNYGPVKQCIRTVYQNKRRKSNRNRGNLFPPARVIFYDKRHAEQLFGQELLKVARGVELNCPVGHRNNKIFVRPCMLSVDLLEEETSGTKIGFSVSNFMVGHWCSSDDEMLRNSSDDRDVWLEVDGGVAPQVTIDTKTRNIELSNTSFAQTSRISLKFKQLSSPMKLCREDYGGYSIVFSLKFPPKLHKRSEVFLAEYETQYERELSWENMSADALGLCLGYKLLVSEQQILGIMRHEKFNQLREFGVIGFEYDALQNPNSIISIFAGYNFDETFESALKTMADFKLASLLSVLRDNKKLTAYHAITNKITVGGGLRVNIFDLLSTMTSRDANHSRMCQTLDTILGGFGSTKYPCSLVQELLPSTVSGESATVPPHCVSIPRMRVTPLGMVCAGFEAETSNRAVRHFTSKPEFTVDMFLRVTVTEEDGGYLPGSDLTTCVKSRIHRSLVDGITLCGRNYVFLAYSSSQLKECSVWMVCLPPGWSVVKMRDELGDFSQCVTASKLGARLGQCFSTTFTGDLQPARESSHRHRRSQTTIADIEGSQGCHSDGTGMIRRDAAEAELRSLVIAPNDLKDVSVLQIRYQGAKGTLLIVDQPEKYVPMWTPRADIYLRPSMIKFSGKHSSLEVCSVGKNIPYYLNRNVILLLTAHGVASATFLSMQKEMLDELDRMLTDPQVARRLVPSLGGPDNQQRSALLHMLYSGLSPLKEPFLYDCLSAMRNHHLYTLRKKSRVWVEKGCVLVGGLDESGRLPEGCVFFQVGKSPHVGQVMVTKHPVMHPGDVRMMTAMDVPELRQFRNVVLFSQRGRRPEADKMSGSDLDGDEFAITWDARLFLHSNREAMDYAGTAKTNNRLLPSSPEHISGALVEHFLDHIKNASLGQIANLWLDYAAKNGADCKECLTLAELHSVAVDYPKSGVPAEIPGSLRLGKSPRAHWREKKYLPSFHCDSVIGQLYDQVIFHEKQVAKHHKNRLSLAGRHVDRYGTIVCEVHQGLSTAPPVVYENRIPMALTSSNPIPATPVYLELAKEERALYEEEVMQIMNKYKIRGEGETFTGCIRKFHKLHKKRQHDFAQEVRRQYGEIRTRFRRSFFESVVLIAEEIGDDEVMQLAGGFGRVDLNGLNEDEAPAIETEEDLSEASDEDERLKDVERIVTKGDLLGTDEELRLQYVAFRLASAYYDATYHRHHRWTFRDRQVALFSFPWVVADVIGNGIRLLSNCVHI